jgi:hypothetical protein
VSQGRSGERLRGLSGIVFFLPAGAHALKQNRWQDNGRAARAALLCVGEAGRVLSARRKQTTPRVLKPFFERRGEGSCCPDNAQYGTIAVSRVRLVTHIDSSSLCAVTTNADNKRCRPLRPAAQRPRHRIEDIRQVFELAFGVVLPSAATLNEVRHRAGNLRSSRPAPTCSRD